MDHQPAPRVPVTCDLDPESDSGLHHGIGVGAAFHVSFVRTFENAHAERRARVELPPVDVDLESGRARLSYRRAAETFEQATENLVGGPWTLHQLRHSALTHAAEDGANTSTLLAYSGHRSVASLARYSQVSQEALGRWQQARDPERRR